MAASLESHGPGPDGTGAGAGASLQRASDPTDANFKKRRRITLKDMRQPATECAEDEEFPGLAGNSEEPSKTMKKRPNRDDFELCPITSAESFEDIPTANGNDVDHRDDITEAENETAPILQKNTPEQTERQNHQRQRKPCLKKQTQSLPAPPDNDIELGNGRRAPDRDSNGGIPSNQRDGSVASGISEKFRSKYVTPVIARTNSRATSVNSEISTPREESASWWFCPNCFRKRRTQSEDEIYIQDDPFKKRCLRACLTLVYILLALIAGVVTYSMVADLLNSMNYPVRSIRHREVDTYEAPGIAVYPGGADFLACGHYYNNVVTSKVRLEQLDLKNHTCTYTPLEYTDPYNNVTPRQVIVVRGPTSFLKREAIFLHFSLEDETRDFFTVSYFVFPAFDAFNKSEDPIGTLTDYHKYMPTFALSSELRMWIKLIMSEDTLMNNNKHTEFKVEYSVVKFYDERTEEEKKKHLFFIFFEWKNNIIEESHLIYTMTPWSIGAGLCGVFLTLHRGYQLAQVGYKRFQKDKQRRSIRKRTIRELQSQMSVQKNVKQRRLSTTRQATA